MDFEKERNEKKIKNEIADSLYVQEELKKFPKEDVINILFELLDKKENKNYEEQQNLSSSENDTIFSKSDKHTLCKLQVFIQVLLEKYGEEEIVNLLFKNYINSNILWSNNNTKNTNENKILKRKTKKNNFFNDNNLNINKFKKKKIKSLPKKIIANNSIKLGNINGHLTNSKDMKKKVIKGLLHKNKLGNTFLFYPSSDKDSMTDIENSEKLKNNIEIIFKCELDNCSGYGRFNLNNKSFELIEPHSFCYSDHIHCDTNKVNHFKKINDNYMSLIKTFSKMKSMDALIFDGNELYELKK